MYIVYSTMYIVLLGITSTYNDKHSRSKKNINTFLSFLTVSVKRRLRTRGKMQRECKMQTAD